jgi:hypothetical protein
MKHVAEPFVTVPPLLLAAVLGLLCGIVGGLTTCFLWGVY